MILIRIALSAIMFIHGAARINNGTVGDFGEFLAANGLPLGFYAAWGITIFELVASVVFAIGVYAWLIAVLFVIELIVGIFLVHARAGWFVVGSGRNGMEFSVLLIVCFLAVALTTYRKSGR